MAVRESFLLVDGNNVIFAWPELRALHARGRGAAHRELELLLNRYQDWSGERVVLVFDGRGDQIEQSREANSIQIIWSDSSHTADDIIERLAGKYAGKHRLVVATDDVAEQQTVSALGADVMSAAGLKATLERADRDLSDRIKRMKKE